MRSESQNMYCSPEWRVLLGWDHLVNNNKSGSGYKNQQHLINH